MPLGGHACRHMTMRCSRRGIQSLCRAFGRKGARAQLRKKEAKSALIGRQSFLRGSYARACTIASSCAVLSLNKDNQIYYPLLGIRAVGKGATMCIGYSWGVSLWWNRLVVLMGCCRPSVALFAQTSPWSPCSTWSMVHRHDMTCSAFIGHLTILSSKRMALKESISFLIAWDMINVWQAQPASVLWTLSLPFTLHISERRGGESLWNLWEEDGVLRTLVEGELRP